MGKFKINLSFRYLSVFSALLLCACTLCIAQQGKPIKDSLDEIVTDPVDSGKIAGIAVTVIKKGELIYDTTYGFADLENRITLTPAHQFQIASITKNFTATAILKLSEVGKIRLEDKLSDHLDEFVTRGHDPTIQQLLHHTSGLPEYTRHLVNPSHGPVKGNILSSIQNVPPYFEPGTKMAYSNSAYYLLGLIIERISKMSYDDFVEKELLKPYGLNNISYYQPNDRVNRVKGYQLNGKDDFSVSTEFDPDYPFSAGSISANSLDLIKWFYNLNNGKILSRSSYNKMLEVAKLPCGHTSWYGLGLMIETDPSGRKVVRYGGSHPSGFTTDLRYYPAEDIYISVLINTLTSPDRTEKICNDIADMLTGQQQKVLKATYPENSKKVTGSWI